MHPTDPYLMLVLQIFGSILGIDVKIVGAKPLKQFPPTVVKYRSQGWAHLQISVLQLHQIQDLW